MEHLSGPKQFFKEWQHAKTGIYGAAVAYYTVFSLAPLLVIAVSIAGIFFNSEAVQGRIIAEFSATFGPNGAALMQSLIASNPSLSHNIIATVVGVVFVLLGGMGVFSALESGLDVIFEHLPKKRSQKTWKRIMRQLASLGMVFSLGFVLLASLVISSALAAFGNALNHAVPGSALILVALEFVVSFALISLFLSALLLFLPSERISWKSALFGGLLSGALFTAGKYVLSTYFGLAHTGTAYGAASAIVLIILWTFYLSQALFASAVATRLYFIPKR